MAGQTGAPGTGTGASGPQLGLVAGVVLAPGAGASTESPPFVEFAAAVASTGLPVERMDFPYRIAGRRRPDPPRVLEAAVLHRASSFADDLGVGTERLLLGGRSMGGRICSQVVAAGLPAAGLVLVSYPLHPPGHPEKLRTAHFPGLRVPCLFVSGTRDAFASPNELEDATRAIPGQVTHVWLEGGDHGLRRFGVEAAIAVGRWIVASFELAPPNAAATS